MSCGRPRDPPARVQSTNYLSGKKRMSRFLCKRGLFPSLSSNVAVTPIDIDNWQLSNGHTESGRPCNETAGGRREQELRFNLNSGYKFRAACALCKMEFFSAASESIFIYLVTILATLYSPVCVCVIYYWLLIIYHILSRIFHPRN